MPAYGKKESIVRISTNSAVTPRLSLELLPGQNLRSYITLLSRHDAWRHTIISDRRKGRTVTDEVELVCYGTT